MIIINGAKIPKEEFMKEMEDLFGGEYKWVKKESNRPVWDPKLREDEEDVVYNNIFLVGDKEENIALGKGCIYVRDIVDKIDSLTKKYGGEKYERGGGVCIMR